MKNLKKVISLHQASQISGYHQDYLSSLIRKNEIEGQKVGGAWVTTEEEVRDYIFKQEIRNKNWLIKLLLSFKKNKSFVYSFMLLMLLAVGIYFYNKKFSQVQAEAASIQTAPVSQPQITQEPNF